MKIVGMDFWRECFGAENEVDLHAEFFYFFLWFWKDDCNSVSSSKGVRRPFEFSRHTERTLILISHVTLLC